MKICFYIVFICISACRILVAQNLVPNPNFETYSSCPVGGGEIHKATPWFVNYSCSGCGSSDYFNACASTVPSTGAGLFQYARSGVGYAGIIFMVSAGGDGREYIEVELIDTLKKNRRYCGAMYLSLINNSKFLTDRAGIFFSKDSVLIPLPSSVSLLSYNPQIKNPLGNFLSDTLNWMPVSGVYVAQGGEKFITIGNFNNDVNTSIIQGYGNNHVYFYIDDVSVVELPEAVELTGMDTVICRGDSIQLGIGKKQNVIYAWIGQGVNSSEAQVWVKPSATTTYTLIISDTSVVCANINTATIVVTVKQDAIVNAGNDTAICEGASIVIGKAAKPNYSYTWSPAATLSNSGISQPIASPQQTTTYYVTAADTSYGFTCNTLTDSIKITVINCDTIKPNSFWVPTAFSPNGDNNNEILYVYGKNILDLQFEIYNRWGERIFESKQQNKGWDGKINNENAPESIYAWYAKVKFNDGEEKIYKGTVLLVR